MRSTTTTTTNNELSAIAWAVSLVFFISAGFALAACAPNQRIMNSAAETPTPVNSAPVVTSFAADLQAMRDADFKFILVFRRKDGGVLTAEDKSFANANTPYDANRRRLADDGKAVIIGTNFPFLPDMLTKMTGRFSMENYSKPDSGPIASNSVPNK